MDTNNFSQLIDFAQDNMFWIIGGTIAIVAIVAGTLKEILTTRTRERSRREIAAYIAEGSIKPEDGEKLMKADRRA